LVQENQILPQQQQQQQQQLQETIQRMSEEAAAVAATESSIDESEAKDRILPLQKEDDSYL
jgi:hypothetical protein